MNSEITIRMLAPAPNNNCHPVRSHLAEKCSETTTVDTLFARQISAFLSLKSARPGV
jgi:hypothetical protein